MFTLYTMQQKSMYCYNLTMWANDLYCPTIYYMKLGELHYFIYILLHHRLLELCWAGLVLL